jgi:hypothetical protein
MQQAKHMMKKNFFLPALAIVAFAGILIFSAFKFIPAKAETMHTFYFNEAVYSVNNVQDESKWQHTSSNELCDYTDDKACRIQVQESMVNNPSSSNPTLKTSANITAQMNATSGKAFVTGISDPLGQISNSMN